MPRLLLCVIGALFFSCEADPISYVKSTHPNGEPKRVHLLEVQDSGDSLLIGLEQFYSDGTLEMRGEISNGARTGQWLYYFPDGGLWSECEYTDGKRHGKSATYFPNGQVRYSGKFVLDSMMRSTFTYYDSLGNKMSSTIITQP